jgi:Na+/melibiose symporter-like transporter
MENNAIEKNRASFWQLFGFAGNNAATNALFVLISGSMFLAYGADVYGFSTVTLGLLAGGTRVFDAITDPIIGVMVDKTNTRIGRFRPWIIAGSLLSNAMFLILFWGLKTGTDTGNFLLLLIVYIIWVIGYTFQTSISKAGQNVLTSDPKQRTTLNAISGLFTMVVFMTGMILYPILVPEGFTNLAENWQNLALVMVGLQIFFTIFSLIGIWKKDIPENYLAVSTSAEKPSAKDYIEMFKNNKALQMLVVAASTNKVTLTIGQGLVVFFYAYVVLNPAMQSTVTPTTLIFMLLATFSVLAYTHKKGRKISFTHLSWGAFIWGLLAIGLIALAPSNFLMLVLVLGINSFFMGGTDLNVIPMIGDAADYENYNTGKFIPGMIGTAFSFIDKLVSSLGAVISGFLLAAFGFVSLTETEPTPLLFWGILITYFLFPALGHLASVIAMKYYPLDNEMMAKMHEELDRRHMAKSLPEIEAEIEPFETIL